MSGITLKNPVVNSAPIAISLGRKGVGVNGLSLSTGLKANNDVVSSFLGRNLNDRSKILNQFYKNVGYGSNIAQTTQEGLNSIARTLVEMQGIINSVGGSETSIRTLNDIFQQKLLQVEQQTSSVKFDGVKLLTGEFGSDPTIKSKYNTKPIDVRKIGAGSYDLFEELGAKGQRNIQFTDFAKIKQGDTITLENIVFTMMDSQNIDKTNENQIAIGSTLEETVGATVTAIKNHSSEVLRIYDVFAKVDNLGKLVIIQQRSQSYTNIQLAINSSSVGMVDNSQPSTYRVFFNDTAVIGSKVSIAGVEFEYVANGTAGGDPTKVERKDNSINSVLALATAIRNNPKTKDLIDKKVLSITQNNRALYVQSTLSSSLLQLGIQQLGVANIHLRASSNTTYARMITILPYPPLGVSQISFTLPDGTIKHLQVTANLLTNMANDLDLLPLATSFITFISGNPDMIRVFSNYDMNITHIPPLGGVATVQITPLPISPNDVAIIKAAIDVSRIHSIDGFIGTPSAEFRVIAQATGDAAETLYKQTTSQVTIPGGAPANPADSVAIIEVNIAGRTFQSVVWKAAVLGNLNNTSMVFKEGSGGESFSVNTRNFNPDFTSLTAANDTLAAPLRNLFASTVFAQTRDLDIDTSNEKIINDEGRVIGNVTGMTASLNSTDFTNKEIQDFTVIPNPAVIGQAIFSATISGKEFLTTLDVESLNEGTSIVLSADNGDKFTINIGKDGLNSLKEPENYKFISSAIKKSLMKIGSGIDVRTGFDSDNVTKLVIADISATKLYRNNQNEYVPKLDLLTKESAKVAQEVITNALNLVYSARAKIQGQSEGLDKSVNFLNSTISVTKDASGGYLDTDLVEAASAFAAALKSILAAVSTLQAGAKVADAGLEIIKSAA